MCSMLRTLLLALACLVVVGCSSSESAQTEAPERDGYSGQMGVVAGDINDYGN